ncbi:MAG: ATP-dependent sacrificial sulfur transferase LarE [Nitrospirae bacterium]|nr:ATP-dependent sacrificial sulfur transferase LarE [Nitrospirota bacterium]
MKTSEKLNRLKKNLKKMDRAIIAFSGGVDSTFLLKAASVSGLKEILAVTAVSQSLPEEELSFAKEITAELNIPHRIITSDEMKDENYSNNPPDRCYYCKKELFTKLKEIASEEGFSHILDGSNADDMKDWRPGRRAAEELNVISPLLEAGLSKNEIRELSKAFGLRTWDKPSSPCLSSRFPYGQKITSEALERVGHAEAYLKTFNLKDLRVRDHGDIARIEVLPDEFHILFDASVRKKITAYLKALGYKYITLDLRGFSSGGFNEHLKIEGTGNKGQGSGKK